MTDEPRIQEDGETALIACADGSLDLSAPKFGSDDIVPGNVLFVLACFQRAHDEPKWAQEQVDWIGKNLRLPGFSIRGKQ